MDRSKSIDFTSAQISELFQLSRSLSAKSMIFDEDEIGPRCTMRISIASHTTYRSFDPNKTIAQQLEDSARELSKMIFNAERGITNGQAEEPVVPTDSAAIIGRLSGLENEATYLRKLISELTDLAHKTREDTRTVMQSLAYINRREKKHGKGPKQTEARSKKAAQGRVSEAGRNRAR